METRSFFAPDVEFSAPDVGFASSRQSSRPERAIRRWLQASVVAAAASGLIAFYCQPASLSELDLDLRAIRGTAEHVVECDAISPALQRAAARLSMDFVKVPLTDADLQISPDYDL